MDISKHIRNYLSENSSVVVPGLGRFTAADKPSEILGDVVVPPRRTIEYDSSFDEDDGILTAYIAQKESITPEQAKEETAKYYDQLKTKLAARKNIMLGKLGTLSINATGDIVFEPDADLFIERTDSFGLKTANLAENPAPEPDKQVTELVADTAQVSDPVPPVTVVPPAAEGSEPKETPSVEDTKPADAKPASDDAGLFASNNMRVRENTERRRPPIPDPQPVKPRPGTASAPKPKPVPKSSGSGFPMWLLIVLLGAAGLAAGAYFLYPKFSSQIAAFSIFSPKDTTQPVVESEPEPEPQDTVVNTEVAQTLDEATDKKNALKPEPETPKVTATAQPATQQASRPAASVSQQTTTGVGQGRYLLIVGSFTTRARAERFGKSLQNEGISYEIIDFGNERIRIAVAAYDNKTEAFNELSRFKSKPLCEGVWVVRR